MEERANILVVDDERGMLDSLVSILEEEGHNLHACCNGSDAIKRISAGLLEAPIDLVISDLRMPDMTGLTILSHLKKTRPEAALILMTAYATLETALEAVNQGAYAYHIKPLDMDSLIHTVHNALAQQRLLEELQTAKRDAEWVNKELEKQLVQSQRLASMGRLVGGVAHDFNNVLTIMMGYSQMGMIDIDGEHSLYPYLQELAKAGEHAASLTGQLLSLLGHQSEMPKVLNLNSLVYDVAKLLSRLIREDIQLTTQVCERPVSIFAAPTQIEQLLINLAINARDAMSGGGELTIQTAAAEFLGPYKTNNLEIPAGEYALLSVTDTGCGMSDEVMSKIFEPFFTTKGEGKGTGLGLDTCSSIVRDNHGWLQAESRLGQGTTFQVYLPLASSEVIWPQEKRPSPTLPRGSETILIVEDEAALRNMEATILIDLGYTVFQVANSRQGLNQVQKGERIDLLLSDVVMPGISGPELARQVKALQPQIKVILTSGYTDEEINLAELGPDASLINKPFFPAYLASRVREVLDCSVRAL